MPEEKPVTFDKAARARIARSVRWTESGDDPSGQRPVDSGDRWGKVKTAWASTTPNKITVNLCRQDGSETDTGRDWTVYLTTPLAAEPDFCGLAVGDVIAFRTIYDIATATVCGLWSGTPDAAGDNAPIETDYWFDCGANKDWTTLDARDWTDRLIWLWTVANIGAPAAKIEGWDEASPPVTYYRHGNFAVAGSQDKPWATIVSITQDLVKVDKAGAAGCTFEMRVNVGGGELQWRVTAFANRTQVRVRLTASARRTAATHSSA